MFNNNTPDMFKDLMQMFDPKSISKAFDPMSMMQQFAVGSTKIDPQETFNKAQGQFEAMTKANEAAAKSYRDLLEKQMKIFQDLTAEAAAQAQKGPPQDVSAAYQQAVERALDIMTELSDAARTANVAAYQGIQSQVDQAIKDLKS